MSSIQLGTLATVSQLAKLKNMSRRGMAKQLLSLHARSGGDWMLRSVGKIWINVEGLRAAHPAFFQPADLLCRMEEAEDRLDVAEQADEAQARAVGALTRRVEVLERARSGA